MPYEVHDFRKVGVPDPFAVTVVERDEIDGFLGTGSVAQRVAHLRGLRDLGLLVHNKGRLTQRIRTGDGLGSGYVFRCRPDDVPRRRRARRPRQRVTTW